MNNKKNTDNGARDSSTAQEQKAQGKAVYISESSNAEAMEDFQKAPVKPDSYNASRFSRSVESKGRAYPTISYCVND